MKLKLEHTATINTIMLDAIEMCIDDGVSLTRAEQKTLIQSYCNYIKESIQ